MDWQKIDHIRKNAKRLIAEYRRTRQYGKADALVHKLKVMKHHVMMKSK